MYHMRNVIVRKYYSYIFYETTRIRDVKIVGKEDFENFKKALDEIKNKKTYKVLVFDSLRIDHIKSNFNGGFNYDTEKKSRNV